MFVLCNLHLTLVGSRAAGCENHKSFEKVQALWHILHLPCLPASTPRVQGQYCKGFAKSLTESWIIFRRSLIPFNFQKHAAVEVEQKQTKTREEEVFDARGQQLRGYRPRRRPARGHLGRLRRCRRRRTGMGLQVECILLDFIRSKENLTQT